MEITANAAQTVAAGQNVVFSDTAVPGNCSIMHREGSGLAKLRGLTSTQCRARFKVTFGGNIAIPTTGAVGAIRLAIAIDGEPVPTTTMIATPSAEEEYFNVFSAIYLDVPAGCCITVAVENISTQSILVQNANLIVERVA